MAAADARALAVDRRAQRQRAHDALSQDARDDACQVLGYAANQAPFHATLASPTTGAALAHMSQILNGDPSDDAACGGLKCFEWLAKHGGYELLPTLRPADVHDVIVPLWLRKEGAAKDAAGKALRHVLGRKEWLETHWDFFVERDAAEKLSRVISEMNSFEELKQMRTTGEKRDQLRPNAAQPLSTTLESDTRREALNVAKVVELLARDLEPEATIVDVGAGTGLFTFAFADALGPSGDVVAMEVRTDALQELNERIRTCGGGGGGGGGARVTALRIGEHCVPALPRRSGAPT